MNNCQGIWGWFFGHDFQPVTTKIKGDRMKVKEQHYTILCCRCGIRPMGVVGVKR